jgi:hypothetical protein
MPTTMWERPLAANRIARRRSFAADGRSHESFRSAGLFLVGR